MLAEITDAGRAVVEAATADLVAADFGLGALDDDLRRALGAAAAGPPGGRRLLSRPPMTTRRRTPGGAGAAAHLRARRSAAGGSSRSSSSSTSRSRRTSPRWASASRRTSATGWSRPTRRRSSCRRPPTCATSGSCAHLAAARERRDARAGHRRLADVRPAHAARPAGAPGADGRGLGDLVERRSGARCGRCCTRTSAGRRRRTRCVGAPGCSRHLRDHPTPKPPGSVEVRDGQVYRWDGSH